MTYPRHAIDGSTVATGIVAILGFLVSLFIFDYRRRTATWQAIEMGGEFLGDRRIRIDYQHYQVRMCMGAWVGAWVHGWLVAWLDWLRAVVHAYARACAHMILCGVCRLAFLADVVESMQHH